MKQSPKNGAKTSPSSRSSNPSHLMNHPALDTLPIGVVLLDSRLRILSVNAEAARLLGHSADFCSSKPLQEVLRQQSDASGSNITTRIQESCSDRHPIHKSQTTLLDALHELHPVEWTCAPLTSMEPPSLDCSEAWPMNGSCSKITTDWRVWPKKVRRRLSSWTPMRILSMPIRQ